MNEDELLDALDGLYAYDGGAVDSGIKDERLRTRVKAHLLAIPYRERDILLGRIARELYLTDDALEQGSCLEGVEGFIRWLRDQGVLIRHAQRP